MSSVFHKLFSATLFCLQPGGCTLAGTDFCSHQGLFVTHGPTYFCDTMKFHPQICCLSPAMQGTPRGTAYAKDRQSMEKRGEVRVQVAAGEAESATSTAKPPWSACTGTEEMLHMCNGTAFLLWKSLHGGTWMGPTTAFSNVPTQDLIVLFLPLFLQASTSHYCVWDQLKTDKPFLRLQCCLCADSAVNAALHTLRAEENHMQSVPKQLCLKPFRNTPKACFFSAL